MTQLSHGHESTPPSSSLAFYAVIGLKIVKTILRAFLMPTKTKMIRSLYALIAAAALVGCTQRAVSYDPATLDVIPPEVAWNYLRSVTEPRNNMRPNPAVRVCRIDADNRLSDHYNASASSVLDASRPDWRDGQAISTTTDPTSVSLAFYAGMGQWAVWAKFMPTQEHDCILQSLIGTGGQKANYCKPSRCMLWGGDDEKTGDATFRKIATAASAVGMKLEPVE